MAIIPRFLRPPETHCFLFGPRGTGKTTWLRSRFPQALWIDLLEHDVARAYLARPERLRAAVEAEPGRRVVVVDEIQKAPALLDVVHSLIEKRRGSPRFVLTGSSARKLRRTGVNLLGGRALRRSLHPFLAAELGDGFELRSALQYGLVPAIWSRPSSQKTDALSAYVSLYMKQEVQDEGLVRDFGGFSRFLEAMSFSHGAVVNLSNVARECEVSRKTVQGYLEILEDLMLGFRVDIFTRRAQRHLAAHPKFYLFDTGVFRCLRPRGPFDSPSEIAGAALEGLVAQHLRAWIDYRPADLRLFYWRTRSGNEVDFVLYGGDGLFAIEVKSRERLRPDDLRGLKSFVTDYPQAKATLLYPGRERLVQDGILCQPVEKFLRQLHPNRGLPV
jgi:predicted AAA+ superfamily ATPase